jgi:formyltetrahydrofolate synthetase
MLYSRGNISMFTTIVGALGMVMASALTAWASSSAAVADVKTQVVQVTERENNHYEEVQKSLERIEKKLDAIPVAKLTATK